MAELKEVFEMTTKQMEPDQDSWNKQEQRQRSTARNRKVVALLVAAAIGLAAVLLILETRPGETARAPANESSAINPGDEAVQVAEGFLDAFGAFDADRARTYLAEDADITGMTEGKGVAGLDLMTSWLEATGYHQTVTSCQAGTSGFPDITVSCAFEFDDIRSQEIGRGPFIGSDFWIIVRDGEISRASMSWEIEQYSPQMWEPFADWVSTTYPEDAAVMYHDATLSSIRLTEKSIRLWDERSREYVKEVNRGTAT
jgi:hypothetical protein